MIVGLLAFLRCPPSHNNLWLYKCLDPYHAPVTLPLLLSSLLDLGFLGLPFFGALRHTASQASHYVLSRFEGFVLRECHPLVFLIVHALLHLPVGGWAVFPLLGKQHLLEDDTARGVQMVERALVPPIIVIPGLFH